MFKKNEHDDLIVTHFADDYNTYLGAVVPPVFMNSLHVFDTIEDYYDTPKFVKDKYVYGRVSNPTVSIVEQKVAALERGTMALCFGSGMAAMTSAIMAVCKSGDHIICIRNIYGPTKLFLTDYVAPRLNMTVTFVGGQDICEIEEAICSNTALIILESPTSLVFNVIDIKAVTDLAKKHGIRTCIDNTYCTPVFQKPIDMGVDLVMHTASKYLGGHSDIIAGVLVSSDKELMKKIAMQEREWFGGILGPMEAWLMMRGIRTLPLRVKAHFESALKVAEYLEKHSRVRKVNYPALKSHPDYDIMEKQQDGCAGLLSFEVDADVDAAKKVSNGLNLFKTGVSWGGFESLTFMPFLKFDDQEIEWLGSAQNLIRIHIGLEGTDNLIEDLEQSLSKL